MWQPTSAALSPNPSPTVVGEGGYNRDITMNQTPLQSQLETLSKAYHLPAHWLDHYPHLFSPAVITLSQQHLAQMQTLIAAAEKVCVLPAYQEKVLSWAADSAQFLPNNPSVFMGYDFHLTPDGPKLIEINTNAGGAALNALLQWAAADLLTKHPANFTDEHYFITLFQTEWQRQRGNQPLKQIAIVDTQPSQQFLYPEFLLFQTIFERHHIATLITDPAELQYKNGQLLHGNTVIDLVYNRLTDFTLQEPVHAALLNAYRDNAVVLTPHPRAYALYADKRNLTLLSDENSLREIGVADTDIAVLTQGIPSSFIVNSVEETTLWEMRRSLFFKPFIGHGSKGVYRGDKLTKRVFAEIVQGDYIAQTLAPPDEINVKIDNELITLKYDVRYFVYDGQPQNLAARLYQGQTTNFRTRGGGFALITL